MPENPARCSPRASDVRLAIIGAVLERHLATFEWPSPDEPHCVVEDAVALEEWPATEASGW